MPTLDRPNAPKRLPSGLIDSAIFRKRFGEGFGPSFGSPFTGTSLSGSPISPLTNVTPRATQPSHLNRLQSDSEIESPTSPVLTVIDTAQRRASTSEWHKSRDSQGSEPSSTRSSISARARKLFKIPPSRSAGKECNGNAPPPDAKQSLHWVREISGHWLEIRIVKQGSDSTCRKASETLSPGSKQLPSKSDRPSGSSPRPNITPSAVALATEIRHGSSQPPAPEPRENFVDRTRRRLGLKRNISDLGPQHEMSRTKTGEVLQRTSSKLRLIVRTRSQRTPSPTASSRGSSGPSTSTSASLKPKWQFVRGDLSNKNAGSSSSSSMRSVIQGKPPPVTPDPQEMYQGSDQHQYFRVDMTDAAGPNFLPSEARRVMTPPMGGNKARGFFFDYKHPSTEVSNSEPFKSRVSRGATSDHEEWRLGSERTKKVDSGEWYKVQLDAIEGEGAEGGELDKRARFLDEIPDHLANSPMCPRNSKHKSGGKGTCTMHGKTETEGRLDGSADGAVEHQRVRWREVRY